MSFRIGTLLCLTGMAACSNHTSETAVKDPSYVDQSAQPTAEPTMTPASSDNAAPRPTQAVPSVDEGPAPVRDPVVADTKGTKPGDLQASDKRDPAAPAAPPAAAPDNTRVNKRDANSAALTPIDQGNDETSLKVTQQIRQALMADDSLSFTAKNVKIITRNGKVTLRGPVNSEDERSRIEAAAQKIAGAAQVDNQLEVKK